MNSASVLAGTLGATRITCGAIVAMPTIDRSRIGSHCRFCIIAGLPAWYPLYCSSSVCPSGWARTTALIAMLPFAPGRFSTTTGWPSAACSPSWNSRAAKSVPPPGGFGTITVMGRLGKAPWARSGSGAAIAAPAPSRARRVGLGMACPPVRAIRALLRETIPQPCDMGKAPRLARRGPRG